MSTGMDGYPCPICQMYVLWGGAHNCPGYNPMPHSPALPGIGIPPSAQPTPGCRAPWLPLMLEDIRKVVREELEAFAKRQTDAESSPDPTPPEQP